ncbi:MAG TPA: hypothetical protein VKB57_22245 [Acidimicrobiales bacterium]|nr:hypothetical protein [Acidimicrobiales bacterium]
MWVWEPREVVDAAMLVLAHQGGWDEMLMVLLPIVIFAVLLIVANRRAGHIEQHQNDTQDGSSTP